MHKVFCAMEFSENRFQEQIAQALERIKLILENDRKPQQANEIKHSYNDKYALADFITNSAIASTIEIFQLLGLTKEKLIEAIKWVQKEQKSVTMSFTNETKCTFTKKKSRKIESSTQTKTKINNKVKLTDKVVTKVTDYFWNIENEYSIQIYAGSNKEKKIQLNTRKSQIEIKTNLSNEPYAKHSIIDPIEINITWFLLQVNLELDLLFTIDRSKKTCKTPRRNNEINEAIKNYQNLLEFNEKLEYFFQNTIFTMQIHNYDLSIINDNEIFIPILVLLEKKKKNQKNQKNFQKNFLIQSFFDKNINKNEENQSKLLLIDDFDILLNEQIQNIKTKFEQLESFFPSNNDMITEKESKLIVLCKQFQNISKYYQNGINFIEKMLENQIIQAIGKEISELEFEEFMNYHYQKIFKLKYKPKAFSYPIRRKNKNPEGFLSIESDGKPIYCFSKFLDDFHNKISISLHSSTSIHCFPDKYIHSWISYQFSNEIDKKVNLIARSKQFCCFIVILGNMINKNEFQPKSAIFIQNKDEILIPLLISLIPTPKAFKKSVESLSKKQKEFANLFRNMQLENSLFSICIIEIKSQFEKILNLPKDSLLKEIQLTQDIIKLFVDYQISSDLLSFEDVYDNYGNLIEKTVSQKIDQVKNNVSVMMNMINNEINKNKEEMKIQTSNFDDSESWSDSWSDLELPTVENTGDLFANYVEEGFDYEPCLDEAPCISFPESITKTTDQCKDSFVIRSKGTRYKSVKDSQSPVNKSSESSGDIVSSLREALNRRKTSLKGVTNEPKMEKDEMEEGNDDYIFSALKQALNSRRSTIDFNEKSKTSHKKDDVPKKSTLKPEKPKNKPKQDEKEVKIEILDNLPNEFDFTKIPALLNSKFNDLDTDDALHGTTIKVDETWEKTSQNGLLGNPTKANVNFSSIELETNKAFDLLDSITRSGAISIDAASLHVFIASTHCFDKTLLHTVVQDNVNPIEKLDRSALIISGTIYEESPEELLNDHCVAKIKNSPVISHLFE